MAETTVIDSRAVVHEGAEIGAGSYVGPFCVIGPRVRIGEGSRLEAHVVVDGLTEIGPGNEISPMVSIGTPPQDLKYAGEPTRVAIGARNRIREFVTINRGTQSGGGLTAVGDDNLLMAYAHVAHDCRVGSRSILANAATLAGHVTVGDDATVGAFSGVHQFCRIADHAFIGGYSVVTRDALPWVLTVGNRAKAYGLNLVGLRRKGYSRETIDAIKRCYGLLFRSKTTLEEGLAVAEAELAEAHPEVRYFIDFVRGSERGVCR